MTMLQIIAGLGGKPNPVVSNQNVDASAAAPADATAAYELRNDGVARTGLNASYSNISGEWLPEGTPADYDCRVTLLSGTLTTGTVGSWLNLGTTRSWTVSFTDNAGGNNTCVFTIEIGLAGASTAIASAEITLSATVEAG